MDTREFTTFGLTNDVRACRLLDELGRETGRIRCVGYKTRPHEIQLLAADDSLLWEWHTADGGGLVSIGRAGRVVEVDASGNKRWQLTGSEDLHVFRAQRIPSLQESERSGTP